MIARFLLLFLLLGVCFALTQSEVDKARQTWKESTPFAKWRKDGLSNREIVKNLVANLTLHQKIRQLDQWQGNYFLINGNLDEESANALLSEGIGQIHDLYPPTADIPNRLQQIVLNLYLSDGVPPIPIKFSEECLHGLGQGGHTVFPQSISLASSWDDELAFRIGQAIGSESRAYNIRECFAPVMGIAREPRWGRTEETYGEDQHLGGTFGHAVSAGLQKGESPNQLGQFVSGAGSLLKHFISYSDPQGGRNTAPTRIGQREFLSDFTPSFYQSLSNFSCPTGNPQEFCLTQAIGTMGAYSERDGIPNCSDEWLLTDLIRLGWGFDGYVLGDLGAIRMMWNTHRTATSPSDSIKQFLEAGGHMQFYDFPHAFYRGAIAEMVQNGTLSEDVVTQRVEEVLYVKSKLGLFDDPFVDPSEVPTYVNSQSHQDLALEAARKSIILLKNNNSLLPLPKNSNLKIALIGPNSDASLVGDYSGNPDSNSTTTCNYVTVKEGLENVYSNSISSIVHIWGTPVQDNGKYGPLLVRPAYLYPNSSIVQSTNCLDGHGLIGEYYNNPNLSGPPLLTRLDTQINFNWYHYAPDAPANVINAKEFSVRWTGILSSDIPQGFGPIDGWIGMDTGGDPVRIYLNGDLIVDHWENNLNSTTYAPYTFNTGNYSIIIEYAKNISTTAQLEWSLYGNNGFDMAVTAARQADVAIICVGEDENTSGENHDRVSLDLPGRQEQLIQSVYETGTPVIVVLLNGRPLSTNWTANNVDSILECFFTGQAEGIAIAEVLFGDYNPAGRLPITVPLTVGQVPMYYNHKPSSQPNTYVDFPSSPLYHFGHGLSYTTFHYYNLSIVPPVIPVDGSATVSFYVTNNGSRTGDEVPQMYVTDNFSSVTTPIIQLRGYERLHDMVPNETRLVQFPLIAQQHLWLIDRKYQKVVEPGNFTITVGASSHDLRLVNSILVA